MNQALETAIMTTRNQNVLVLGTEGTIKSEAYRTHIKRINPHVEVHGVACPGFCTVITDEYNYRKQSRALSFIKH